MKEENKTEPTAEQSMEEKPFNQLEAVIKMSHEVARPWKYLSIILSLALGATLYINYTMSKKTVNVNLMADNYESTDILVEQNHKG